VQAHHAHSDAYESRAKERGQKPMLLGPENSIPETNLIDKKTSQVSGDRAGSRVAGPTRRYSRSPVLKVPGVWQGDTRYAAAGCDSWKTT
jgi:hypothetical protein